MGRRWTASLPPFFLPGIGRRACRQHQVSVWSLPEGKVERSRKRLREADCIACPECAGDPKPAQVPEKDDLPFGIAIGEPDRLGKRRSVEPEHSAGPVRPLRRCDPAARAGGIEAHALAGAERKLPGLRRAGQANLGFSLEYLDPASPADLLDVDHAIAGRDGAACGLDLERCACPGDLEAHPATKQARAPARPADIDFDFRRRIEGDLRAVSELDGPDFTNAGHQNYGLGADGRDAGEADKKQPYGDEERDGCKGGECRPKLPFRLAVPGSPH